MSGSPAQGCARDTSSRCAGGLPPPTATTPRLENKAASKKEKFEKIMEQKMRTPTVSLYKDAALGRVTPRTDGSSRHKRGGCPPQSASRSEGVIIAYAEGSQNGCGLRGGV